jgi:hypothetical protein
MPVLQFLFQKICHAWASDYWIIIIFENEIFEQAYAENGISNKD